MKSNCVDYQRARAEAAEDEIKRLKEQNLIDWHAAACEHARAEHLEAENKRLRELLGDCLRQLVIVATHKGEPVITTGGLSVLEDLFDEFGYTDPQPVVFDECGLWQALWGEEVSGER